MSAWTVAKLVLGGLFLVVLTLFAVQNPAAIRVEFLMWETTMSTAVVVLLTLVAGVLFGAALTGWLAWRSSHRARSR